MFAGGMNFGLVEKRSIFRQKQGPLIALAPESSPHPPLSKEETKPLEWIANK